MGVEMEGFDELQDDLEGMAEKAKELDGENEVPIEELFPDEFMEENTDFESLESFFRDSPWDWERDDLEDIPEEKLDEYVRTHSQFSSWEEMMSEAGEIWAAKQLGFS